MKSPGTKTSMCKGPEVQCSRSNEEAAGLAGVSGESGSKPHWRLWGRITWGLASPEEILAFRPLLSLQRGKWWGLKP